MSFLFSLTFLRGLGTPKNSEVFAERPVSFSPLISRIKHGSGPFHIRDDQIQPINPLLSAAYESTFANLTPDESEMVGNTYGDEVGVQYAESIINFSKSCEYAVFIVDHLVSCIFGCSSAFTSSSCLGYLLVWKLPDETDSAYSSRIHLMMSGHADL